MLALELIIGLLLLGDIGTFLLFRQKLISVEAAIAAINEDLVEMDADLDEICEHVFPANEVEGNPPAVTVFDFESEFEYEMKEGS
jgi:hypothetical protein